MDSLIAYVNEQQLWTRVEREDEPVDDGGLVVRLRLFSDAAEPERVSVYCERGQEAAAVHEAKLESNICWLEANLPASGRPPVPNSCIAMFTNYHDYYNIRVALKRGGEFVGDVRPETDMRALLQVIKGDGKL